MPRSPSRDLVDRFTGNRDYFQRADPLRRWKSGVALAALGLTFCWLLVEFLWPSRAVCAHSPGDLANPHAAFDAKCEICHIRHSAGDFFSDPFSVFSANERWRKDLDCTACHAGPIHHARARDTAFHERCSNCHRDHRGRDHSLTRIADSHCSKCHGNLPAAHEKGERNYAEKITGFTVDHPEFGPLKHGKAESERKMNFSHALHMTPGLTYKLSPGQIDQKFGPDASIRFPKVVEAMVQLECSSCHQLDAGHASPGAYFQPVNFDAHCKVCHSLNQPTSLHDKAVLAGFAVPHRRQPAELRPIIRGGFAARLAIDKHPPLFVPPGPGGRLDPRENPEVAAFGNEVDRLTDSAMNWLEINACFKCHDRAAPGKNDVAKLPDRSVWFPHAKFNHVSHRGLTCASCHPGTDGPPPSPGMELEEREPALIVGMTTCQKCHAAAGTPGLEGAAGGVRHGCTDCHRYHNGDRPLQGLGASKRDPVDPLSLNEWLKGKK